LLNNKIAEQIILQLPLSEILINKKLGGFAAKIAPPSEVNSEQNF
jgi:hypothetical protein